ncbi:hypothetical protein IE81DRAFT_139273 [Ceraceosorus guamensis]|uniref:Uncharacterized protein n=1 Tax=Ceraceosorus guamensis TaxID=1522189 RepID=A0A316W1A2_9BASI|nr:hypothetical protein IE81DRAFT_139273 [Ceraceosorus guamensis]PWN42341.1 hypothetical protein IE81DRAFT_139273 [Ceraceosorus guamensis]
MSFPLCSASDASLVAEQSRCIQRRLHLLAWKNERFRTAGVCSRSRPDPVGPRCPLRNFTPGKTCRAPSGAMSWLRRASPSLTWSQCLKISPYPPPPLSSPPPPACAIDSTLRKKHGLSRGAKAREGARKNAARDQGPARRLSRDDQGGCGCLGRSRARASQAALGRLTCRG